MEELVRMWLQAESALRQALAAATNALDQELQTDPFRNSESRGDGERILFVYPLGAHVEIEPQKRIVRVLNVWRFRRRGEQCRISEGKSPRRPSRPAHGWGSCAPRPHRRLG